MYGVVIAFKDYNVFKGINGSEWAGLEVFRRIFKNANFWSAVRNTLLLNLTTLCVTFPITIIVSLMLNEVLSIRFKKISQSLLYLPHFISWVVVAGIATNLFSQRNGTINNLLLGNDKVMGVSEVISTYVYRLGIQNAKYSDSTAIGLFQSVVNILILFLADKFAKLIGEEGII